MSQPFSRFSLMTKLVTLFVIIAIIALGLFVKERITTPTLSDTTSATDQVFDFSKNTGVDVAIYKPGTTIHFIQTGMNLHMDKFIAQPGVAKRIDTTTIELLTEGAVEVDLTGTFNCSGKMACPALAVIDTITILSSNTYTKNVALHGEAAQSAIIVHLGDTLSWGYYNVSGFTSADLLNDPSYLQVISPYNIPNMLQAVKRGTAHITIRTQACPISCPTISQSFTVTIE